MASPVWKEPDDRLYIGADGKLYPDEKSVPGDTHYELYPRTVVDMWYYNGTKGKEKVKEVFKNLTRDERDMMAFWIRSKTGIQMPVEFIDGSSNPHPLDRDYMRFMQALDYTKRGIASPNDWGAASTCTVPAPAPPPLKPNALLSINGKPAIPCRWDPANPKPKPTDLLIIDEIEEESMIKWLGEPITSVLRTLFREHYFSISKANDLCQRLYMTGAISKRVSPVTIQSQKNRAKTRSGCAIAQSTLEYINELLKREFNDDQRKKYEEAPEEETSEPTNTPSSEEVTDLQNKVSNLEVRVDTLESEVQEQKGKIAEVEELALATCRTIEIKLPSGEIEQLDEMLHPKTEDVVKLVQGAVINGKRERINTILIGPAGSGKTYLAAQVARILKMRAFGFISCSAGMSESNVLGRMLPVGENGTFAFVSTVFIDIFENGGLFLFDEVDAADANMPIVLNTALSNGILSLPSRVDKPIAKRHKNCIIMAAANTFGNGADRLYVGRNQLDAAFLDRFRMGQVFLNYSEELEAYLCPDAELRNRIQGYRSKAQAGGVRQVISTRFMKDAYVAKMIGFDDKYIDNTLFSGWKEEERRKVGVA